MRAEGAASRPGPPSLQDEGGRQMATVKTTTVRTSRSKPAKGKQSEAADRLRQVQRAAVLLKQVSDPTRLRVIAMLSEGERHVGGLCAELNQSQPAGSH